MNTDADPPHERVKGVPNETSLELENIRRSYGPVMAVDNVSLVVGKG
jgi:hypothetical protein